ncbi:MAG: S8 family serine peptidase [Bacteroidota bacterium]
MRRIPLLFVAALLFFAACSDQPAAPGPSDGTTGREAAAFDAGGSSSDGIVDLKDRYIVVFKDAVGNTDEAIDQLSRGNGSTVHYRYRYAIKGFCATIPAQALEGIRRNPNVAYIEADAPMHAVTQTQNNPPSWGLDRIDQTNLPLNSTYIYNNDGTGVTAYIIDTGIRYDHQEFGNRASFGFDAFGGTGADGNGHGTHVSGTVGGITVGVAKNVSLVAVRVLNNQGSGTTSGVIAGIDWVKNNHTSTAVANMSLGGGASTSLDQAVANAVAAGVTFVVAAGNDNANASNYSPAREPSAITVGSTTNTDARSSFSNYGSILDVFAPGSSIYSSYKNSSSSYATLSGTSMATPHVVGVAALYLGANPNASPAQVTAAIVNAATPGVVGNPGTGSPNLLLYSLFAPPTPGTAPAAPTSLTATAVSSSAIDLSWSDPATNESGFYIERSTNGTNFTQIASVGANVTSFSNTGLSSSTHFYYQVRAYNSYGTSSYSNVADAFTQAPPATTAVHVGAASGTSVLVQRSNWTATLSVSVHDASHNPVSGVTVSVSWSGGASGSSTAITNASGVATVTTPAINRKKSYVDMTVTNLSGANITYSSGANHAALPVRVFKP